MERFGLDLKETDCSGLMEKILKTIPKNLVSGKMTFILSSVIIKIMYGLGRDGESKK